MSFCTILITKKSETKNIQEEIKKSSDRLNPFGIDIHTKYYSQKDFKKINFIYDNFEEYNIITLEDYGSSFEHISHDFNKDKNLKKIKEFRENGWNEEKIKIWLENQERKYNMKYNSLKNKKIREDFLFSLSEKYFIAFAYYWQDKKWEGFNGFKIINKKQNEYEENIIYILSNKKKYIGAML